MNAKVKENIITGAALFFGSAIFAAGLSFFMTPNNVIIGGLTGIAQIINFFTGWPIGVMVLIVNIPLYIIGWRKIGLRFVVTSLIATVLSSVFVDVFDLFDICLTHDVLLAALFGGVITGIGLGMIFFVGSSTGGTDIVSKLINMKAQHLNMGSILFCFDLVILVVFMFLGKNLDRMLYSLMSIYLSSKLIDVILYGFNYSKTCYIISDMGNEICAVLNDKLERGVTIVESTGGYTGVKRPMLICVIKRRQITELKSIVSQFDPNAFVIVTESNEVFGDGFIPIDRV